MLRAKSFQGAGGGRLRQGSSGQNTIPFPKMPGNGRAEKCVPLLDFPNREAHIVSGGLFDQITHRAGVDRLFDIRLIVVCRKHEHFGGRGDFENLASGLSVASVRLWGERPIAVAYFDLHMNMNMKAQKKRILAVDDQASNTRVRERVGGAGG
jgi:hypothetical protein